jgi:alkaline phosphatase D
MDFMRRIARLLAVLGALLPAATVEARLVVMQGFADYTSAVLWMQADRAGPIAVDIAPEGRDEWRRFTLDASADEDFVRALRIPGLQPGTRYRFVVRAQDEARDGTLRTQAYAARVEDAPELAIALGSCHFIRYPVAGFSTATGGDYQIFDAIAAKQPDLMLWLGDNIYLQAPDFTDPTAMAAHYRQVRGFEPAARLFATVPQLAIWDDHDYGPNDGDRSYVFKDETLRLFKRYWPNPSFGLPGVPGIFGWVRLGDVEIFLLDDRYHRHPNRYPPTADKSMWGTAQFQWLKEALVTSRARIKLVANGSQLWNRASRFEGLHQFPAEQKQLADWLLGQRIDGVVFLSGDRHFGELLRVERAGAYPLYEFTASPLTSRAVANVDAAERDNPDLVPGSLQARRHFGMLRVRGAGSARTIAFESYDSDGNLLFRHEVRASDLAMPR